MPLFISHQVESNITIIIGAVEMATASQIVEMSMQVNNNMQAERVRLQEKLAI